jgi:tRNA A-37 threonylcarbamoyl transferase component Bud32
MSLPDPPRIIVNSVKAILGEEYSILSYERLPSRRNEVYKIIGADPSHTSPAQIVAKLYKQPGIAHEISILQKAHQHNLHVPAIIGTTAAVLILEYIDAPNLCDLITLHPDRILGHMLASWLAQYHGVFDQGNDQVLLKGDARVRNFLVQKNHIIGVDFEESHMGIFIDDLAMACASILDTTPIFTENKMKLCLTIINQYGKLRQIPNLRKLKETAQIQMVQVLQDTAKRRGNPPQLMASISQFQETGLPS